MHLTKLSLYLIRIGLTAFVMLALIWSSSLYQQATNCAMPPFDGMMLTISFIGAATYCAIYHFQMRKEDEAVNKRNSSKQGNEVEK